ncbi:MAG: T9SS type A sorting domain-containing protein [Saprospiraceae bacterium]|nr:T9SS type A sorting domain-containing protein [Saprospiraceae bacterium]
MFNCKIPSKILLQIILFLTWFGLSAQVEILPERPYEKLVIEGLSPIWYETSFDSTFIGGDTCDGYNLFEKSFFIDVLFEYPYFYKIYHKWGVYQANGTYIEKRNIETGELIWQIYYGLPVDTYQEFGRLMYINNLDQLEVISQLKPSKYKDPKDLLSTYDNTLLSKRIYQKETGQLIHFESPNVMDSTLLMTDFSIWVNYNKFLKNNSDSITYYRFNTYIDNGVKKNHLFSTIDHTTTLNNLKTKVVIGNDLPTYENLVRLSENEYILVEKGLDSGHVNILYFDKEFNLKEQYTSEFIGVNPNSNRFKGFDPVHQTILISYQNVSNGIDPTPYDLIVLDRQGKILRRTTLDKYYTSKFAILNANDHTEIRIIACGIKFDENDRVYSYLDILNWKDNNMIVDKRFYIKDSLRILADFQIHQTNPDHLLINWWERTYYYDQFGEITFDVHSSAMAWTYIKTSDLITASTDFNNHTITCKVYPIPARDQVTLEFDELVTGSVLIHDISGRFIQSLRIENSKLCKIDVSSLNQGTYIIYLKNYNNQISKAEVLYKF